MRTIQRTNRFFAEKRDVRIHIYIYILNFFNEIHLYSMDITLFCNFVIFSKKSVII